jgi:hypothetical protein
MEGLTDSFVDHIPARVVGRTYYAFVSRLLQWGYTVFFHIVLHFGSQ